MVSFPAPSGASVMESALELSAQLARRSGRNVIRTGVAPSVRLSLRLARPEALSTCGAGRANAQLHLHVAPDCLDSSSPDPAPHSEPVIYIPPALARVSNALTQALPPRNEKCRSGRPGCQVVFAQSL